MKLQGAIFDMDGTLVDSLMFWDDLWEQIGRTYWNNPSFRPDGELDKKVRTMIYSDAMVYFKEVYKLPGSTEDFVRFAESGVEDFYRYRVKTKPGAIELLDALQEKGIRMCLASATAMREIRVALESMDLAKYFDAVLSCADIGVGKDRPDIYEMSLKALRLPAERVCVFEDSYVALETAAGLGCRTVGIFDRYNFGQDRLRAASEIYVEEGQSLSVLIGQIET